MFEHKVIFETSCFDNHLDLERNKKKLLIINKCVNKIVASKPRCHKSLALKPNVRTKLFLRNQNIFKKSCFEAEMSEHKSYFETKCLNKTFVSKPKCFLKNLATKFKCLNTSLTLRPNVGTKVLLQNQNVWTQAFQRNQIVFTIMLLRIRSDEVWTKVFFWNVKV
jgi:hypothetical protein